MVTDSQGEKVRSDFMGDSRGDSHDAEETLRLFERLTAEWKQETAHLSSPAAIAGHPAYQEIIGMGEKAIPLILQDLQQAGGQWFRALRSISGESPIRPEDRGNIAAMARAWVDWGIQRRYIGKAG